MTRSRFRYTVCPVRGLSIRLLALAAMIPAAGAAQALETVGQGPDAFELPEPPSVREAPRHEDGRMMLQSRVGEAPGLWVGGITTLSVVDHAEVPYQPWARELVRYRRSSPLEPHTRCKPSGGPRQFLTPYGVEFVEIRETGTLYIFDVGGPHTYRIVHMDGRPHPDDLAPSYYGHNVGYWDGDTLVIESVGYNERFWMDRGRTPHTERLRMVERFTRTDFDNMKYEVRVDDPGVYTAPWTGEFDLRWMDGAALFEYICQDNNYAIDIMIGAEDDVDRSRIVP